MQSVGRVDEMTCQSLPDLIPPKKEYVKGPD